VSRQACHRWWLSVAILSVGAAAAKVTLAEEPVCSKSQISHRAYQNAASNKTRDTVRSFEHELELCKGKVDKNDHLWTLIYIVRTYLEEESPDLDGCRRAAERGLRLVEKGGPSDEINEWFGYCGGDCSKSACVPCCQAGAKKRQQEGEDKIRRAKEQKKTPEERDSEQTVSCDFKKARQLVEKLDRAAFGDSALRLIAKYRNTCAKEITPPVAEAVANDEALVHYHRGDDAACLKALSGLPADSPGTAFNRALCGGPCSVDAGKCGAAGEARKKTIAARVLQAKLRARTLAWCAGHEPAAVGRPAWDLTGTTAWKANPTGEREGSIIRAGDMNGDGIGDLIFGWDDEWKDTSSAALNGYARPTIRWKAFSVTIGCGQVGDYHEVLARNTQLGNQAMGPDLDESDDNIGIGVVERPKSTVRSVCIYATKNVKCTRAKCNSQPENCADLSEWEKAESAAAQP
jgi:hypothetical protein